MTQLYCIAWSFPEVFIASLFAILSNLYLHLVETWKETIPHLGAPNLGDCHMLLWRHKTVQGQWRLCSDFELGSWEGWGILSANWSLFSSIWMRCFDMTSRVQRSSSWGLEEEEADHEANRNVGNGTWRLIPFSQAHSSETKIHISCIESAGFQAPASS